MNLFQRLRASFTPWPNNNAHMLFSTSILLGKALWFTTLNIDTGHSSLSSWWIVGFLLLWAVGKEFAWDVHVEKSQGYIGAAFDAGFYAVGLMGTVLALHLTGKF